MDLPVENVWGDVETEATIKRRESENVAPNQAVAVAQDLPISNLSITQPNPIDYTKQNSDFNFNVPSRASSVDYALPAADNWGADQPAPISHEWTSSDRISTTTPRYSASNSALIISPVDFDPLGAVEEPLVPEVPKSVTPPPPTLQIQVLEPLQVGDKISGRIEYRVATKTTLPFRNQSCSVMRRFSDFLWLYNQLLHKYPGVIIPPVPDKQAVGRFGEEFIETRRVALQRFMNLISQHQVLQVDSVLQQFCESETFVNDKKVLGVKTMLGDVLPMVGQAWPTLLDTNPVLKPKRDFLMALETSLVSLGKSLDILQKHRLETSSAMSEMGQAFKALPKESLLDASLKQKLLVLGDIHVKIGEIQAAEANISPQTTVNEYIRLLGSIKLNFLSRQKIYERLIKVEKEFKKKEQETAKVVGESKIRTDKISTLKQSLTELELELENESKFFEKMTESLISELERDEVRRIEEFNEVLKSFVQEMLQRQKEIQNCWKQYYSVNVSVSTTPIDSVM